MKLLFRNQAYRLDFVTLLQCFWCFDFQPGIYRLCIDLVPQASPLLLLWRILS